jgi:GT2 family glycosyltransferase
MNAGRIAAVIIGRNEGERLIRCLASLATSKIPLVYVDSGSTDGSVTAASASGAQVICLDMSQPFTAARARNAGLQQAKSAIPDLEFVQFVDGDCEMDPGWIATAMSFLDSQPEVAVAFGRLKEKFPDASIYNRLCDLEWDTPLGESRACGGIAMMRVAALDRTGAFRESLIAGEEPELCVRLRAAGWKIWRIEAPMAMHDAAMTRFSQWWRRALRGGHAFAEGSDLHGAPPEKHWVVETRRAVLWGFVIPLLSLALISAIGPVGLLPLIAYPLQFLRLALTLAGSHRALRAFFLVLGKFPEALGVIKFHWQRVSGRTGRLIEYKT